jgi:hypothetical protein
MLAPIHRTLLCPLGLALVAAWPLRAQEPPVEDTVRLEAFNVTAYHGKIPLIDGFTGKDFERENSVVFKFAQSFNKLLLGYHRKLVLDEVNHLRFRIKLGQDFAREMGLINTSFGFSPFALDTSTWLRRERAIISRLVQQPFFKIKALVAWDLDRLAQIAPHKPDSKYAADIRYDPAAGRWERRITARWDVAFFTHQTPRGSSFATDKMQGLNLDTQRGFHFIERGLPVQVPAHAFQEVQLTYPIFYSDQHAGERELRYLQETFVANLYYIYDPFSWAARRDTRFRGGFAQDCLEHIQAQRISVDDRDWFDGVLARFLSDVVTIKLQGAEEIYALHMLGKRLGETPRVLGVGLDLLNWNKGEKREAVDKPEAEASVNPASPGGVRYVLIDAYQRLGEPLVEKIAGRLGAQKQSRQKINGRAMLAQVIAELSGQPYEAFAQRAKLTQEANLARHKLTRPVPPPAPATGSGQK